jgi:hypothetical protein
LATIPLDSPAARLAPPRPVDLVVLARRVGLGRAQALGEADEHHPDRAGRQRAEVVPADVRRPQRRQPAVDVADDLQAVVVQVEDLHRHDAERDGEREQADEHGQPVDVAELAQDADQLLEEVARVLGRRPAAWGPAR